MRYDNDKLTRIYDKTDGHCHICHKKLAFANHGVRGSRGAWQIEHSIPKSKGGSDHLNNLFPACVKCNVEKGTLQTKTARAWNGNTRAPYSAEKKEKIKAKNTRNGAITGGLIGSLFFGPIGTAISAVIGGAIGKNNSPKK